MCKTIIELVISAAVAIGTVAVAVLAIWGDWFRARFAPALLTIEPHNLTGDLTQFSSPPGITVTTPRRVYFYHLKVVNKRRWLSPKNCRVLLKGMSKRGPDGDFRPISMPVPLQFVWAPAEITPALISLEDEQVLDFGTIQETNQLFMPRLYSTSNNFQGAVAAGEAVRYSLQIVSDGFVSKNYHVFEVAWDGTWSPVREEMQRHLVIKEIKES